MDQSSESPEISDVQRRAVAFALGCLLGIPALVPLQLAIVAVLIEPFAPPFDLALLTVVPALVVAGVVAGLGRRLYGSGTGTAMGLVTFFAYAPAALATFTLFVFEGI